MKKRRETGGSNSSYSGSFYLHDPVTTFERRRSCSSAAALIGDLFESTSNSAYSSHLYHDASSLGQFSASSRSDRIPPVEEEEYTSACA